MGTVATVFQIGVSDMSANKSAGQVLIERIEAYLASYIVFPNPHYALLAALWALNTHFFEAFDAVPYLALTAVTKRAGKTTLLELLSFLCRNAERIGAATRVDTLYSVIELYDSKCVLMFDEAERMSVSTASTMRAMMNAGYRKGEYVWRKVEGKPVKLGCYGPKAFALIGDPTDTLRDRSILFVLRRAIAPRPYRPTQAEHEAAPLVTAIQRYIASNALATMSPVAPSWLENRDQEIMEPLWSVVLASGCDAATQERFQRAASFVVAGKGADLRRFIEHENQKETEKALDEETYSEKAARDLLAVIGDEKHVTSDEAVRRMRALPTAPWDNFKGEGLTVSRLADLVRPLGIRPGTIWIGSGRKARKSATGYTRTNVAASVPSVRASEVSR